MLGKEIPCVGRDRELGTLMGLWDECSGEPVARTVLVTAPAGGGKSRVRHELLDRIQFGGEPFELLVGRGDALRAGAPFALLGPALRAAAGLVGGESAAIAQQAPPRPRPPPRRRPPSPRGSPPSWARSPTSPSPTTTSPPCAPPARTRA